MIPTQIVRNEKGEARHIVNGESYEYNTHQPFLCFAAQHTKGNILECGMGFTSTLILKSYLKDTDRKLISLESYKDWFDKFSSYQDKNFEGHLLNLGEEDTDEIAIQWIYYIQKNIDESNIDFVFLDQVPFKSRERVLHYFKDKVKYIVLHDVDYFAVFGKFGKHLGTVSNGERELNQCDFSEEFKHTIYNHSPVSLFCYRTGPPTLIMSNTMTKEEWDLETNQLKEYLNDLYKDFE